jgi:hypothetical protein
MQHTKLFTLLEDSETKFISMINPLILEEKIVLKHLYVKYHPIKNLLYFGTTEESNPIIYLGSGKHWKRHLKKYGKELVQTLCIWTFNYQSDLTRFALEFSEDNDIVASKIWANEIIENGLSGIPKGTKRSIEYRKKCSAAAIKREQNKTSEQRTIWRKNITPEQKAEESKNKRIGAMKREQNMSDEQKKARSERQRNSAKKYQQTITIEQKAALSKKCSDSMRSMKLYDKLGEKSRYFKEQPEDPSWTPRKKI